MTNIVTWEYYSSHFSEVTETEFETTEEAAEREVRKAIGPIRWADITSTTFGFDILQDCICQTMDQLTVDKNAGLGKGISSVSNDGYSETYALAEAKDAEASRAAQIRAWLSGTGLVGAY